MDVLGDGDGVRAGVGEGLAVGLAPLSVIVPSVCGTGPEITAFPVEVSTAPIAVSAWVDELEPGLLAMVAVKSKDPEPPPGITIAGLKLKLVLLAGVPGVF